jgi:hypothetical protein
MHSVHGFRWILLHCVVGQFACLLSIGKTAYLCITDRGALVAYWRPHALVGHGAGSLAAGARQMPDTGQKSYEEGQDMRGKSRNLYSVRAFGIHVSDSPRPKYSDAIPLVAK